MHRVVRRRRLPSWPTARSPASGAARVAWGSAPLPTTRNKKKEKKEKEKMSSMQQMQYNAPNRMYVFQNVSGRGTPEPPFRAVTQNLAPFKILAVRLPSTHSSRNLRVGNRTTDDATISCPPARPPARRRVINLVYHVDAGRNILAAIRTNN